MAYDKVNYRDGDRVSGAMHSLRGPLDPANSVSPLSSVSLMGQARNTILVTGAIKKYDNTC